LLDGAEPAGCSDARPDRAAFSADGAHLAFPARYEQGWAVVRDGVRGPVFPDFLLPVDELVMSADGRHVAYDDDDSERGSYVVFDGRRGRRYSNVYSLTLSPDGRRIGYVATRIDGQDAVVADTAELAAGNEVLAGPLFSPDGAHVAGVVRTGDACRAVLDGVAGPEYVEVRGPAFSGDGSRFGYLALARDTWRVIVDGEVKVQFPDGSAPGELVLDQSGAGITFSLENAGRWLVWHAGKPGPVHDRAVSSLRLSPDGAHVAYVVGDDDGAVVVVDSVEGPSFGRVFAESFRFSPDGRHHAYFADFDDDSGQSLCCVLDGELDGPYVSLVRGGPTFAADGALEFVGESDSRFRRVRLSPEK
jgi:WD40 repeat protein